MELIPPLAVRFKHFHFYRVGLSGGLTQSGAEAYSDEPVTQISNYRLHRERLIAMPHLSISMPEEFRAMASYKLRRFRPFNSNVAEIGGRVFQSANNIVLRTFGLFSTTVLGIPTSTRGGAPFGILRAGPSRTLDANPMLRLRNTAKSFKQTLASNPTHSKHPNPSSGNGYAPNSGLWVRWALS